MYIKNPEEINFYFINPNNVTEDSANLSSGAKYNPKKRTGNTSIANTK